MAPRAFGDRAITALSCCLSPFGEDAAEDMQRHEIVCLGRWILHALGVALGRGEVGGQEVIFEGATRSFLTMGRQCASNARWWRAARGGVRALRASWGLCLIVGLEGILKKKKYIV